MCGLWVTQVIHFRMNITEVVIVGDLIIQMANLRQLHGFMKCHFRDSRRTAEARIPSPPIRAIKAAAERVCVAERRVDDSGIRDSEYQFMHADPGYQIVFPSQAIVGRVI